MKVKQSLTLKSPQLSKGHTHTHTHTHARTHARTHTHTHTKQAVIINQQMLGWNAPQLGKPRAERRLEAIRMTSLRSQVWELRA